MKYSVSTLKFTELFFFNFVNFPDQNNISLEVGHGDVERGDLGGHDVAQRDLPALTGCLHVAQVVLRGGV